MSRQPCLFFLSYIPTSFFPFGVLFVFLFVIAFLGVT